MEEKHKSAAYLRNFVFGVEDSLVSTVGLLSGIAIAGLSAADILLTGTVLIFVEALSMAAGSFLSEHSAEGYLEGSDTISHQPVIGGVIMFISYFVSGFVPLAPYLLFSVAVAFWSSIGVSLAALFGLGIVSAKLSGTRRFRHGMIMLVIGGLAILVGVLVGNLMNTYR